jgi:uncharacterized protein (TIGR02246 family)
MKKSALLLFTTVAIHFSARSQGSANVAGRFRQLINEEHPNWINNINYSLTTNKTIMKKTIFMATLISAAMAVNAQTNTKDEQALRNIVSTMQKGWNAKDGKTFASGFASVHDYIVINGTYLSAITPEMNANGHQGIFNSIYKTIDLELRVDKITFVRTDLAMVYVIGATYKQGTPVPENPTAIISMLIEKKNDDWKIISFHNCDIEVSFDPAAAPQGQIPPKVMYASWYKK